MVVQLRRRIVRQRYIVLHREDVAEAINLAGATYGNSSTLWQLARCESGLNPQARNLSSSAAGLLQFLPSTLRSTPYGQLDIYSPYVSAMAGGWMLAHGRRNEWVC